MIGNGENTKYLGYFQLYLEWNRGVEIMSISFPWITEAEVVSPDAIACCICL